MKHSVSGIFLAILVILIMILSAGCGNNPPTNTTTVTGAGTAPLAPASLTVQVTSTTAITLSWPAVTGAANYNIYRSTFPNVTVNPGNKINPNPVTQTMIQNSNLLANTTYYYIVTSVSANGGESGPSAEVYAKPSTGLIGATVGGTNTNNNPITGIVYGTPNAANPALQIPLLGATVVANNNITTTDMNGAYSVGTASTVVELSAAAQGYAAQTIAGIPAGLANQNLHLNFLTTPISSNLATKNQTISGTTVTSSITVTVTVASGTTPLANRWIDFYSDNAKVSIWNNTNNGMMMGGGFSMTNASGIASATVYFYDGQTSANIAIVSATYNSIWNGITWISGFSDFGYVASFTPIAPGTNLAYNIFVNSVISTPVTITTTNMPTGVTNSFLFVDMPLANGVHIPFTGTGGQNSTPLSLPMNFPINITGITQMHAIAYTSDQSWNMMTGQNSFTFSSYIGANYPIANQTITMPLVPTITSPLAVNSNLPTTITWNPVVGAVQYQAQIKQGGANNTAPTFEWDGFTNALSVTKPLFYPSNGGNMVPGFYDLTLITYPQTNIGLGNSFPINPLTAPTPTANNGGLNGFVMNPTVPAASAAQLYMDSWWPNYIGRGAMKKVTLTVM